MQTDHLRLTMLADVGRREGGRKSLLVWLESREVGIIVRSGGIVVVDGVEVGVVVVVLVVLVVIVVMVIMAGNDSCDGKVINILEC